MARIRTIKPEFWSSEQVVECSTTARLLFIGLWNFSDDGGNHPASAKTLKMRVFPADNFSPAQIEAMIAELTDHGLIVTYSAEGRDYWHVTGWEHQKIEKPSFKFPTYSGVKSAPNNKDARQPVGERSSKDPRMVGDDQPADVEGKGCRRDVEGKKSPPTPPQAGGKSPAGRKRPAPYVVPSESFPENLRTPEFLAAWRRWEKHRREIKKPITETSATESLRRLALKGEAAAIVEIDHTIEKGWQGLRAPEGPPMARGAPTTAIGRARAKVDEQHRVNNDGGNHANRDETASEQDVREVFGGVPAARMAGSAGG